MVVSLKVAKKNKKLILIDGDKAMGKNKEIENRACLIKNNRGLIVRRRSLGLRHGG